MRISVIFFDLIYTLIHLDLDHFGVKSAQILKKNGRSVSVTDFIRAFRKHWTLFTNGNRITEEEFYSNILSEFGSTYSEEKALKLKDAFLESFSIYGDVIPTLEELCNKYRLGVITNGAASLTNNLLNRFSLEKYFDIVMNSREAGCRKPCNKIYLKALNAFGVSPKETLFVSDEYEEDLLTAKKLGMNICLIDRSGEIGVQNTLTIRSLLQLREVMASLV